VISEAINQTKHQYYRAIENSRDAHNDITYFLLYLLRVANDYVITYQNLEALEKEAKNKGYIITETELNYMKKILISYDGVFAYADFLKMAQAEMTKQGALKILNKLVDYGFLREVTSKSKVKLFDINQANIPFRLKSLGFRVAQ
jgi:Fic family protein